MLSQKEAGEEFDSLVNFTRVIYGVKGILSKEKNTAQHSRL